MSVTGKLLYDKLNELRPDLSSGITPEILSKVCDDSSVQPFLEWFCKNVTSANVLSSEEIKLKNTLEKGGEWLKDEEALDAALEEATKDCPDLLKLVELDNAGQEDLFVDYEALKESCKIDEEYIQSLKRSIKVLKNVENKLDDDTEEAETVLNKNQIETEKAYDNCSTVLKEFDKNTCQFSKDVENLLNVYANASKNQGDAALWTQMPIDLFVKQIKMYRHYLGILIKNQFEIIDNKEEQEEDSDYGSLISDSREKQMDDRMHELLMCKTNLTNSKQEEIYASIKEESSMAILLCVKEIYNGGILKVPENSKLFDEIQELTMKKDILEQNVELLRDQHSSEIEQYAKMETIKIMKNDALARLERRKARLEKLKNLHYLAGERGHVYVDLLCMLMEMQLRCLREVAEFIVDARHYLVTEYELSSVRCEVIQREQDEYATITNQSPKPYNAFNKIFMSMMLGDNILDKSLSAALQKYNDLLTDNAEKKKSILETCYNKIDKLQNLENEINKDYIAETQSGPTISFRPISYEISSKCEEISATVQEAQEDITRNKNQLKERMRMDVNLEREKDILWQRFLTEPDKLRMNYEEAKQKANESHFGDGEIS